MKERPHIRVNPGLGGVPLAPGLNELLGVNFSPDDESSGPIMRLRHAAILMGSAIGTEPHTTISAAVTADGYAFFLERMSEWLDTGDDQLIRDLIVGSGFVGAGLAQPGVEDFLRSSTGKIEAFRDDHARGLETFDEQARAIQDTARTTLFACRCLAAAGSADKMEQQLQEIVKTITSAQPAEREKLRLYVRHLMSYGVDYFLEFAEKKGVCTDETKRYPFREYTRAAIRAPDGTNYQITLFGPVRECARAGVLPGLIAEGMTLSAKDANTELFVLANNLWRAGRLLTLGKPPGDAVRSILKDVPPSDALSLVPVLVSDPVVERIAALHKSFGILDPEVNFGRWILIHRARAVDIGGVSKGLAEHLCEKAHEKKGLRTPSVAIIRHSDALVSAGLLDKAVLVLNERTDPAFMAKRIDGAARAILDGDVERAVSFLASPPKNGPRSVAPPPREPAPAPMSLKNGTPTKVRLAERLPESPELQNWIGATLSSPDGDPLIARCLRALVDRSEGQTKTAIPVLKDFGLDQRLRPILASPPAFERLVEFLYEGRREEVKRFHSWLRSTEAAPPAFVVRILNGDPAAPKAVEAAAPAASRRENLFLVPPGDYTRLLVIGGNYSAEKRRKIEAAANDVAVEFVSPDTNFRDFLQTVSRRDFIVVNPTLNSHSATAAVIDFCRENGINWMMMPYSGYERIVDVAQQLRR